MHANANLWATGVDIIIRATILAFSATGIARVVRDVLICHTTPPSGQNTNVSVKSTTERLTGSVASDILEMLN